MRVRQRIRRLSDKRFALRRMPGKGGTCHVTHDEIDKAVDLTERIQENNVRVIESNVWARLPGQGQ